MTTYHSQPAQAVTAISDTPIHMRAPCPRCTATDGHIKERQGQNTVWCDTCNTYQYNAPKTETGQKQRTVRSRETVTPSQRARVMGGRGGTDGVILHLDHLISRDEAQRIGHLDELIDSEWNLAPMCEECNLGKRNNSAQFLNLIYRVLLIKQQLADRNGHNG